MVRRGLAAPRSPGLARLRWPALVAVLTLLIGSALVWLAGADTAVGQPLTRLPGPITIYRAQNIGQTFAVPVDGLHRLDFYFEMRPRIPNRTVELTVTTLDGQPLVVQEYDARHLRVGWNSFTFPVTRGVAGQTLHLVLSRDAPSSSALGLLTSPGQTYPGSGFFDDQRDDSFDLAFRAFLATDPTPAARLARVQQVAITSALGRPGPFGQPVVLLLLGGLYVVGLASLASVLFARARWP